MPIKTEAIKTRTAHTNHTEHIKLHDPLVLRERKSILDFKLNLGSYASFIDQVLDLAKARKSAAICVANVHMFIEAFKSKEFLNILNNADIVTPDGRPLVWSLRLLYGIRQDRVCGMDLLPDLLDRMMAENLSVYFFGGREDLLAHTRSYLKQHYRDLKIAGTYSPPFRKLNGAEQEDVINSINRSCASLVIVVLGCPKQERWMASMKGKVHAPMIGVGGALPVMIGDMKRAPRWMQDSGLEWLFRLSQEPRRLIRRYTSTNLFFLYLIIKEMVKVRLLRRKNVLRNARL